MVGNQTDAPVQAQRFLTRAPPTNGQTAYSVHFYNCAICLDSRLSAALQWSPPSRHQLHRVVSIRLETAYMATPIPTQVGDVLILRTGHSFSTHAVGRVSEDGQQDFRRLANVTHVSDRAAAVAEAKALVVPGRRMFLWNIDTGDWSEISH
jgi:hypothetical protein